MVGLSNFYWITFRVGGKGLWYLATSWQPVLLVEKTGVPGGTLSHNVVLSTPCHFWGFQRWKNVNKRQIFK
jgi:hypothetical protein